MTDATISLNTMSDDDLYEALRRPTMTTPFTIAELRAEIDRRTTP